MAVYEVSVLAATAILGYDMFRDEAWTVAPNHRVITGIAVAGSAAGGDAGVDLMVGTRRIARKYNVTTGFPTRDHIFPLRAFVPAGAKISCPVFDAPGTNPLNVLVVIEDL